MAALSDIVRFLDEQLRHAELPDYPGAVNGLQLENPGEVTRVAAAVDAALPVVEKAIDAGADLLLVHHGMFWNETRPLTGPTYRKVRRAIDAGLAIYASHLPLDAHPEWGNNARLAAAIGIDGTTPFLDFKGLAVGLRAEVEIDRGSLLERTREAVGGPVHLCPGGPATVRRLGIVTGGAGAEIAAVAAEGIDTLVTGEGPHWSYTLAEELGVNLLYAGHYATETFGVKAIARELEQRFELPWTFIDHPTGL